MLAGLEHAEDVGVREHGGDRIEAAAERLADQRDVGLDALVLLGEQLPGAAEAGLDLVEDQRDVVVGAELADPGEVAGRRDDDAGLALDRLDEEADGVRRDRGLERVGVAEGDDAKPGANGPKPPRASGSVENETIAEGAAVEVVGADDDLGLALGHALDLVAPLAHRLDRGLDRLGARVHRQHLVRAGERRELLVEAAELVVAEGAAGQGQAAGLLDHARRGSSGGSGPG